MLDIPVNEDLIEINQLGVFIPICSQCTMNFKLPENIRQPLNGAPSQCAVQGCTNQATQEVTIPFTGDAPVQYQ